MLALKMLVYILCGVLCAIKPLQIFQQSSYRIRETVRIIKRKRALLSLEILSVISIIAVFLYSPLFFILAPFYTVFSLLLYKIRLKKRITFTPRLCRLIAVYCAILIIVALLSVWVKPLVIIVFCPHLMLFLSSLILLPAENNICKKFISKAKQKLEKLNPIVIAITGSFGKTTFKNILAHILKTQYKVSVSPLSYNTTNGLAKFINENEDLGEIFIAEAGARYSGDISEICSLICPTYAVVTSITNQHLETFGSYEKLKNEKLSIITPTVNMVFFNSDNIKGVDFTKYKNSVVSGKSGDFSYSDVKIENGIQTFSINYEGKSTNFFCPLLADYLPSLVTTAVSVAKKLGIREKNIKNAINTLKPIAHRLELLYNDKDVIIDDAYNSNERGFISAVNLLALYKDKTKVLITPGVIELGKKQSEVNERLSRYASERLDIILTYGVNAKSIKRGAGDKCEVFASLNACMVRYKTIQGERAVLFENDLPDVY